MDEGRVLLLELRWQLRVMHLVSAHIQSYINMDLEATRMTLRSSERAMDLGGRRISKVLGIDANAPGRERRASGLRGEGPERENERQCRRSASISRPI